MEILRVSKPPESDAGFPAWHKEANAQVGYGGSEWLFSGTGPWEFLWVEGSLFKREGGRKFFGKEKVVRNGQLPDVICECGGRVFEIRWGEYEVRARCPVCGREEVVYSG